MLTDGSACTLPLQGNLTTVTCEETRAAVMEALREHEAVILDCAEATEIDVAFLQILIAASRAATQANKRVEFKRPPDGVLAEALRRCGFSQPRAATTSLAETLSL